jgi:hypothetical protein
MKHNQINNIQYLLFTESSLMDSNNLHIGEAQDPTCFYKCLIRLRESWKNMLRFSVLNDQRVQAALLLIGNTF